MATRHQIVATAAFLACVSMFGCGGKPDRSFQQKTVVRTELLFAYPPPERWLAVSDGEKAEIVALLVSATQAAEVPDKGVGTLRLTFADGTQQILGVGKKRIEAGEGVFRNDGRLTEVITRIRQRLEKADPLQPSSIPSEYGP